MTTLILPTRDYHTLSVAERYRVIEAAHHGLHRIGHFGFFREQFRQSLWPRAAAQLLGLGVVESERPVTGTTA